MRSTLIGVFETHRAAKHARDELLLAGFADDDISVRESAAGEPASASAARAEATRSPHGAVAATEGSAGTVGEWFRSLFGLHDDDVDTYCEAVRRGSSVVAVSAHSDERIDRAGEILDACGSIDIDERADAWQLQGWARPSWPRSASSPAWRAPSNVASGSTAASAGGIGEPAGSPIPSASATHRTTDGEERAHVGKRVVGRRHLRVYTWSDDSPSDGGGDANGDGGSI